MRRRIVRESNSGRSRHASQDQSAMCARFSSKREKSKEFLKSLMEKSSENAMTFRSDTAEQVDGSDENSDNDQHG